MLLGSCGDSTNGSVVLAATDEECSALPPDECQVSSSFLLQVSGIPPADEAERVGYACQLSQAFLYDPERDCVDERTVSEAQCRLDVFEGTYAIYRGPEGKLWEFGPPMNQPVGDGWTFFELPDDVRPDRLAIDPAPRCALYRVPLR